MSNTFNQKDTYFVKRLKKCLKTMDKQTICKLSVGKLETTRMIEAQRSLKSNANDIASIKIELLKER